MVKLNLVERLRLKIPYNSVSVICEIAKRKGIERIELGAAGDLMDEQSHFFWKGEIYAKIENYEKRVKSIRLCTFSELKSLYLSCQDKIEKEGLSVATYFPRKD